MKNAKTLGVIIYLTGLCFTAKAQQDSTYTYTYNCATCGTFKTVSIEPIELETNVSIATLSLPDTSVTTLATFMQTPLRKTKPKTKAEKATLFNVYPNPAKEKYYLNFEAKETGQATVDVSDLYGRNLVRENLFLKKGMNVIERPTEKLHSGNYIIKVLLENSSFVKKITVLK